MKIKVIIGIFLGLMLFVTCKNQSDKQTEQSKNAAVYTCPMHPQIIENAPGNCPICGMKLVKKEQGNQKLSTKNNDLNILLKPTDEYVISSIPTVSMEYKSIPIQIKALGTIAYDTRQMGSIAARISGRIEKLYVRSRYQMVQKGQKIMDIYSPEILTAQEDLLLLLSSDPSNKMMITSAKQKLLLLGMSNQQLQQIVKKRKSDFTISVYSQFNGYVKDVENAMPGKIPAPMNAASSAQTAELSIKEGMYIQKGQTVFNVYNPSKAWIILNIFPEDMDLVHKGQRVNIVPEVAKEKSFQAKIDFIEPFYQNGSKTLTARVYFNNAANKFPIGSQVEASISTMSSLTRWIPSSSVISLGLDKVVFVKSNEVFKTQKINTGMETDNFIQVLGGLNPNDEIANNAQYLMDSESFIKVNN